MTTTRKRIPNPHADGALALTDGQDLIGHVVKQDGEFFAFDINDQCLGTFDTMIEAARKIGGRQ